MTYIIESKEWRLLQGLGLLLSQRKAQYHAQPSSHNDIGDLTAELLEVELRRAFMVKECPHELEQSEFEQCQANLSRLCTLLNDMACLQSADDSVRDQTYPRLRALAGFLEETTGAVDLVRGSNQSIFRLPNDATTLGSCLDVVTRCNNELNRLLEPPPQEMVTSFTPAQQNRSSWKKARVRGRATFVLEKLFEHFGCETSHEVMLKLIEDPDENSILPDLQLVLSSCRQLELWQEAHCHSKNLGETAISSIRDLCADLGLYAGQGRLLLLLIEKYGLFGAWAGTASIDTGRSRSSLDQLIQKGDFKPPDLDTAFNGAPPARFSRMDKRALAVKLGFCLMDFFDVDIASKKIYFLDSSVSEPSNDCPFLSFGPELPVRDNSNNKFEVGHPALLSFAKLLLEMDFGQSINLDIKTDNSQNDLAWVKLVKYVDDLEQQRNDSYLQAVRGCLVVHKKIAKALRTRTIQSKDAADAIIRKKLYKEIISKLERGLAESSPRPAHKRQRSESPTPSDQWDTTQVVGGEMNTQSMEPRLAATSHKRQRTFGAKKSASPTILTSLPGAASTSYEHSSAKSSGACNTTRRLNNWRQPSWSAPSLSITTNSNSLSSQRPSRREDFEIAIICALSLEYDAVSCLFDEFWDDNGDEYGRALGDPNAYTTGRMGKHNVVLALLPYMGKANAASAAASMRSSYSNLRLALLVGVCGAAPYHGKDEILLGDVIIGKTIVQHDFGRQYPDRFIRKETIDGSIGRANKDIRNLIATFETGRGNDWLQKRVAHFLQHAQDNVARTKRHGKYDHPGVEKDKLFKADYRHKHRTSPTCVCCECFVDSDPVCEQVNHLSCAEAGCDDGQLVIRDRRRHGGRDATLLEVHVGAVASGDAVMKSAADRDRILRDTGAIGFEMESAGVWDEVPSVVVKGVCDYADSHKNKDWQDFAAATAASACKAILERYIQTDKPVHWWMS